MLQEEIEIGQFLVQIGEVTKIAKNLNNSIYDIQEIIEKRKLEVAELDAPISSMTRKMSRLGIRLWNCKRRTWSNIEKQGHLQID